MIIKNESRKSDINKGVVRDINTLHIKYVTVK